MEAVMVVTIVIVNTTGYGITQETDVWACPWQIFLIRLTASLD